MWPVNLWSGTIALSGITGLMLAWVLTGTLPIGASREAAATIDD